MERMRIMGRENRMINLIAAAGIGRRYKEVGYQLPKLLIPVSGVPMIITAIRDMPKSDKWIFIVRREHIDEYRIDSLIKEEIADAIIIPVSQTTDGQAHTCLLAEEYLDPEAPVFIASCDTGFLYNEEKYKQLCRDSTVDCIVWTFTQREALRRDPTAWGWCKLGDDGVTIEDMSVKVPISENPFDDHAVTAAFFFKRANDFLNAAHLMIKENHRINNEFYVDAIPVFMGRLGKRSVIFDVDLYAGWGTPADLYDYQKMEYFCVSGVEPQLVPKDDLDIFPLWKQYFKI